MFDLIRSWWSRRDDEPTPVATALPALARMRRTGYRLHPYRADGVDPTASKIGGLFHRPPGCADPRCPEHGRGLVNILQLRGEDIPGWKPRTLLQVLWCPRDHEQACPHLIVRRVSVQGADTIVGDNTDPEWPGLIPAESRITVEAVQEYPSLFALDETQQEQVDRVANWAVWGAREGDYDEEDAAGAFYMNNLSAAPGWKVGGWPAWIQAAWRPTCPHCTIPMVHLLTISSGMADGGSAWRWGRRQGEPGYDAADIMIGDCGSIYVFECPTCRHFDWNFQCS